MVKIIKQQGTIIKLKQLNMQGQTKYNVVVGKDIIKEIFLEWNRQVMKNQRYAFKLMQNLYRMDHNTIFYQKLDRAIEILNKQVSNRKKQVISCLKLKASDIAYHRNKGIIFLVHFLERKYLIPIQTMFIYKMSLCKPIQHDYSQQVRSQLLLSLRSNFKMISLTLYKLYVIRVRIAFQNIELYSKKGIQCKAITSSLSYFCLVIQQILTKNLGSSFIAIKNIKDVQKQSNPQQTQVLIKCFKSIILTVRETQSKQIRQLDPGDIKYLFQVIEQIKRRKLQQTFDSINAYFPQSCNETAIQVLEQQIDILKRQIQGYDSQYE